MIGWDNGANELYNVVGDTYIKILGALVAILFGVVMLYAAFSFGFTKDIGSSAGTYDMLYRPVLSTETVHFSIKWITSKLAMPVSADGVILGTILIIVQLAVTLYISTIGPMIPSQPEIPDLSAVWAWAREDRIAMSSFNRVKLGLYLFLGFVIIIDNVSDTVFTVIIPDGAAFGEIFLLFITMFLAAFFVNYVMSEMFVTLGCKLSFWGVGVVIILGTEMFRSRKRQPKKDVGSKQKESRKKERRQEGFRAQRDRGYQEPVSHRDDSRTIPVNGRNRERVDLGM